MLCEKGIIEKISAWLRLSRLPFHTVGILPFLLGTFLAWRLDAVFDLAVLFVGLISVFLVMMATYHAGEYFDIEEDRVSKNDMANRFSGGSGVMPAGLLPRWVPFWTSVTAIALACLSAMILQFYLKTGPYTLFLFLMGALPGFFYSTKPVRLVETGWGEIFIGFCYGWLPVASAYYIQSGSINPVVHWIGIPIGLTIFNVILLNEFPDHVADTVTGKRNLLVRIGKTRGVAVYVTVSILSWVAVFISFRAGIPIQGLYLYLPFLVLSMVIMTLMIFKQYKHPEMLEILCGLNILVNLGTTGSYLVAFAYQPILSHMITGIPFLA